MKTEAGAPPIQQIQQYTSDVPAVTQFLSYIARSRSFPSLYSREYFEWKIAANPFGPSFAFLRTHNGPPAAHCSITAKPANATLLGGRRLAELGDTHTHPQFQRQGHFGVLGRHTIEVFEREAGDSLIYGLPNGNALPGWLRHCGCTLYEAMHLREMRLPVAQTVSYSLRRLFGRRNANLERVIDPAAAAATIDRIWSHAASTGWLVAKSAAWWRWRYVDATERYTTFFLRHGDDVRAWVVVKRARTKAPLVDRVTICDVVGLTQDDEVAGLEAVLARIPRPLDVVTIWTQGSTPLDAAATRLGFRQSRQISVVFVDNRALDAVAGMGHILRLAIGDTDNV